jgi:hypothetical protein
LSWRVGAAVAAFDFAAVTASTWGAAILGLLQGLLAGTPIVNVPLPVLHPRMGTPDTSAPAVAMLEPPGFMLLNYGIGTPVVTVLAHIA